MSKIIVEPKNENEMQSLTDFLSSSGIYSISEEEYQFQKQMEARKKLVKLSKTLPEIDITDEEIDGIVNEVRAKRYADENKNNH